MAGNNGTRKKWDEKREARAYYKLIKIMTPAEIMKIHRTSLERIESLLRKHYPFLYKNESKKFRLG